MRDIDDKLAELGVPIPSWAIGPLSNLRGALLVARGLSAILWAIVPGAGLMRLLLEGLTATKKTLT